MLELEIRTASTSGRRWYQGEGLLGQEKGWGRVQGQGGKERNQRVTALGDSRDRREVVIQTGSCTKAVEVREGQVNLLAGGL